MCLGPGLSVRFLAGEVRDISLCSVCEATADGLLELAESTALMSGDCIKAVVKHSILCLATPYKRLLTAPGAREKPLKASAGMRDAGTLLQGHPHAAAPTVTVPL